MFHYRFDPGSGTPIYRQLADQIRAQIHSGALKTGTQLPTVREMADKLHLSCGTVKHVYDCLQKTGDIEMTRRRGTFVKYVRRDQDSRKQQAMNAIDQMIRKLSELNFSPAEIQIFLNLKMREWGLKWSGIRLSLVTEYTELTSVLEKQLQQIANVHINICPLRQLREYPYSIDEQSDVILASVEDGQKLGTLLPDSSKLVHIALRTEPASIAALALLNSGRTGVLCEDAPFAKLVQRHLPEGLRNARQILADENDLPDGLDTLILAQGFAERCSPALQEQIALFRQSGSVIEFSCGLDEGSMLYLEERIGKLRDERQLLPTALRF